MRRGALSKLVTALALAAGGCGVLQAAAFQILINHLGYDTSGNKRLVVQSAEDISSGNFQVIDDAEHVVFEGPLGKSCMVDGWQGRFFRQGDFSPLAKPGHYRIRVQGVLSEPFLVRERLLPESCLADLVYYFRIQRCAGIYDKTDHRIAIFGDPGRKHVDVHGGWYDASGDVSKYLAYLTETNSMVPQGSALFVWCFLQAADWLHGQPHPRLRATVPLLREEALHGADFLVRMQDSDGYFYVSVVDGCTKDPEQREICGYEGLNHTKHGRIKAAWRDGGGMAIAALARASTLQQNGDYMSARYLAAAEKGFQHLVAHSLEYAYNHRENLLDDYCGLLAATELYHATRNAVYLDAARSRAASLTGRLSKDERHAGWWRVDADNGQPFFHASDAGLPVVALLRYAQFENDATRKAAAEKAVMESLRFELAITNEVANPFGYARQYVKDVGGDKRSAFFLPHRNETGYWWSGENARLASLAAAALMGCSLGSPAEVAEWKSYARNQTNWVFGLNPFDACMMQGKGRNNPEAYEAGIPNPPGGICNGITAGVDNEHDIAFLPPPYGTRADWSWRWKEQWLPHPAWLILALAAESAEISKP